MDSILQQITDWLKEMLVSGIMGNLSGMFESVNNQVGEIATVVSSVRATRIKRFRSINTLPREPSTHICIRPWRISRSSFPRL